MNVESVSLPMFAQCTRISSNFAVDSWKMKQLDAILAKLSRKLTKYVLVRDLD